MLKFKDTIGTAKRSLNFRATVDNSVIDKEQRVIKGLSVSSESVIDMGWYREILVHSPESVNLSRFLDGANVLHNHKSDQVIGVIQNAEIREDKRLYVDILFSRSAFAQEIFQDITDGIRRNVSIGYTFGQDDYEEVKEHPDIPADDIPTFRIFRWEPLEVSFVSVPADPSIGVNRSKDLEPDQPKEDINKEPETLNPENHSRNKEDITMPDDEKNEQEKTRVEEIRSLGQKHNLPYDFAVGSNMSIEQYRSYVLSNLPKNKPLYNDGFIDEKDSKEYSLSRALRSFENNDNSFELEIHQELSKKFDKRSKGLLIPQNIIMGKRAAGASDTGGFIGTEFKPDMFIDARRPESALDIVGVNVLTGLKGNLEIPKLKTDVGFGWASAETTAVTEGTLDDGQVDMTPKKGGVFLELTRRLLNQSSLNVDMIVRNSMFKGLQNAIFKVIHHGSTDPLIKGIENLTDSTQVDGADINWQKLVEFKSSVKQLNASGLNMFWVGNSTTIGRLQTVPVVEGQAIFLCSENNRIISRPAVEFSLISDGYLFYGNYENIYTGIWGPFEILFNPYAKDTQGIVRLTLNAEIDVAFAHEESFAFADNVS